MELTLAVPISSSIDQVTRKAMRTRNGITNNHRGGGGRNGVNKVNLLFSEEDSIIWQNSCMGNFTGEPEEKHEFKEQVNKVNYTEIF